MDHQVVGIALVVEETGKGSKLVFKYPFAPQHQQQQAVSNGATTSKDDSKLTKNAISTKDKSKKQTSSSSSRLTTQINHQSSIFFRLPSRTLAKLFRTKPPLCGQPVSLNIEGTVFCCRSVLLQQSSTTAPTSGGGINNNSNHHYQDDNISITSSIATTKQNNNPHNYSSSSLSITMSPSNNTTTTNASNSNTNSNVAVEGLVLFSIIVAFKPMYQEKITLNPSSSSSLSKKVTNNSYNHYYNHQEQQNNTKHSKSNTSTTSNHTSGTITTTNSNTINSNHNNNTYKRVNEHGSGSLHFEAVRKIHLTLSRLCKVLEREEKRCLYVSRQVSHLLHVTKDWNDGKDGEDGSGDKNSSGNIGDTGGDGSEGNKSVGDGGSTKDALNSNNTAKNVTIISGSSDNAGDDGRGGNAGDDFHNSSSQLQTQNDHHNIEKRIKSLDIKNYDNPIEIAMNATRQNQFLNNEEETHRQKLDIMLSASPPPTWPYETSISSISSSNNNNNNENIMTEEDLILHSTRYKKESIPLYGNLALELAQTFHALSRNYADIRPSPESLLSGRDGIVYINHHMAVKVEPVKATTFNSNTTYNIPHLSHYQQQQPQNSFLRSYHTLLFHPVSAKELLAHKMMKSPSSPITTSDKDLTKRQENPNWRRLEKLLIVADDPFKSLSDMAIEAAMTLQSTIDVATSLLESGVCIALPVMTTYTRCV